MKVVKEKRRKSLLHARARKPQNEGVLDFYTLHPIQIHQLSFSPHQASEKKLPTTRKLRWRFPQKRWTFFQKTPTFFCFSPTFFQLSWRKTKKRSIRFLTAKSKDQCLSTRIPIWAIQLSGEKHDFLEKSQLLFVQTNKILYLCDIASKSTAHTLPAKSGVLCSLPYLGLPSPLISLRYTTITTDFAIKNERNPAVSVLEISPHSLTNT